jgi:amino acid adenylation domain-containing protein/FkbH-like protein/non-ribosomal peptide synthase protein (TIGR01720 family)
VSRDPQPLTIATRSVPLQPRRIAIAATFTAEPVADSLAFWIKQLGLAFDVQFAAYSQVFQQLLDPGSLLSSNDHGVNVVAVRFEDWGALPSGDGKAEDFLRAIHAFKARSVTPLIVCLCPESVEARRDHPETVARLEARFASALRPLDGVHFLAPADLKAAYAVSDSGLSALPGHGHIAYGPELYACLGTMIARTVRALEHPPFKVLVMDCDHTLWSGVCGEDGPLEVIIDAPRRHLQEFALARRASGVLLCLSSKNNEADVFEVFDHHPDMILKREHLAASRITWAPKSEGLRSLAEELNVGLDALVMLDDNPLEAAEIRGRHPEVLALTLPPDPSSIPAFLQQLWAFDRAGASTTVDARRAELYRQEAAREESRKTALSFEDFIQSLALRVKMYVPGPADLARVAQLTQRTNQFNTTTIRRREDEVRRLLEEGETACLAVEVGDRFGDYGLVGAVFYRTRRDALRAESVMLSCRALGRGVEHRMVTRLAEEALARELAWVEFAFVPTPRNQPAGDFLEQIGGSPTVDVDGARLFRVEASSLAAVRYQPRDRAADRATPDARDPVGGVASGLARSANHVEALIDVASIRTIADLMARIAAVRLRSRPQLEGGFEAPRTETERRLATVWADALGLDRVGVHDGFFELGGTSLQATMVVNRLQEEWGREIDGGVVFEAPTVAQLAARLAAAEAPPITALRPTRRDPGGRTAPCSYAQQRLWFLQQFDPGNPVYNERRAVRLRGPLQERALSQALNAVVARHESLRTTLQVVEGRPVQVVAGFEPLPLTITDLTSVTGEGEAAAVRLVAEEASRPTDLAIGPVLRAGLMRLGPDDHVLWIVFHHVVADGWSVGVLFRELAAAYRALVSRRFVDLPGLPIQYADYAAWQREWLSGPVLDRQREYWKARLAGELPVLQLPVDRPRPPVLTYRGARERVELSSSLTAALREVGQAEQASLFMVLMAAFQVLLARYTGQDDVLVGFPVANRNRSEIEGLVGFFVNTLVLRTDLSGNPTFREILGRVRARSLEAYAHQDLPFERLVEDLMPGRDLARTPVFQVMLALLDDPLAGIEMPGISVAQLDVPVSTSRFDLLLNLEESVNGLSGSLEYSSEIFDSGTVRRMVGHFSTLLEGIAASPETPIEQLPLLRPAERRLLLSGPRGETARHSVEQCLHQAFETQVERTPTAVAVTFDGSQLTYAELNRRANRLAHHLRSLGVGPDVLVGLCTERSLEMVVGLLGILKAGGAYVPLDPNYPADRLAFLVADSGVPVVVTQQRWRDALGVAGTKVVCLDSGSVEIEKADDANPSVLAKPEHLAYVIYTSGSTGKPKGVLITHANVMRLMHATEPWFRFQPTDVWTLFHSYAFDFSVWEVWGALLYGGRVVVVPYWVSRSPEAFLELLRQEQVTVLNQTPSAFRQLIQADIASGAVAELSLRYVIFGGEALELQSLRPWFERHGDRRPQLVNMYGITETTVHVTYRRIDMSDVEAGAGSLIGVPIPDLGVYVLDAHREPVPVGVPGEMYVGGAGVARGYLNRPELTAERFVADPFVPGERLYRSGDLARRRPDGDLEYLGRIDHQVKIRGFRIELGEIEAALAQDPRVRDAIVLAREDLPGDRRLTAYVAAPPPSAGLMEELRALLRAKLPDYMVPAAFVVLDALPLTAHGKVDRKALPAPEVVRELTRPRIAPRNPSERALAEIWKDVLRLDEIGVEDNFFELGGDSILSIQIISRARQAGFSITPKQLFQHPTVAGLAALSSPAVRLSAEQDLLSGSFPLIPIQRWFFEQELPEPHHWNQAFLFAPREPVDVARLEKAADALVRHHDVLRLRFRRLGGEWCQEYSEAVEPVRVTRIDLSALHGAPWEAALRESVGELQGTLRLESGPLLRIAHFDGGLGRSSRLLLVIHHLAVDGVSWRILLEDLETAYRQLGRGAAVALPAKTTSFRAWAQRLGDHARGEEARRDLDHWRRVAVTVPAALPPDAPSIGPNTEASARTLTVEITDEESAALLQQVPRAYNTQINDVLLTALAEALRECSGNETVRLEIEGHGREDLFDDIDLTRTVGWFTTIFPVVLRVPHGAGPEEALKGVKEQLRAVPGRGLSYGMLRYLADETTSSSLRSGASTDVIFNYLGQFDQVLSSSDWLSFAPETAEAWHSPKGTRRHALEVLAIMSNGRLQVRWIYSENLHRPETVERLAASFLDRLRRLVHHCRSVERRGYTPSDFPLARLEQAAVDRLAVLGDLEDVYPLSPMQQLFHSMEAADAKLGFEQWHFLLRGPLDPAALRRAWEGVLARHPILRTAFVSDGLVEPVQVVLRQATLPWGEDDWSGLNEAAQDDRLRAALAEERARGFDLACAPLIRVRLLKTGEDAHHLLWSTHHLCVDGWSWPLVFRELSALYEEATEGRPAHLERPVQYRDYIVWLQARPRGEAEAFWRRALEGIERPTPLELPAGESAKGGGEPFAEERRQLSSRCMGQLVASGRALQLTLNTLVQGMWAALLSHYTGERDVVFGAAFSGRPPEVAGIQSMVGPCVTNIPVRVTVDLDQPLSRFLRGLQEAQAAYGQFQYSSPAEIQSATAVPWRYRLFESLLVVQNYVVDESARRLAGRVSIESLLSPDATNYPLTLVVEPGEELRLKLVYHRTRFEREAMRSMLSCLAAVLESVPSGLDITVSELLARLPAGARGVAARRADATARSPVYAAPRTEMEQRIADIWRELFEVERVGLDDNFFDLGGHSLLLLRAQLRLRESLRREIPIVILFQYPTVSSLAGYLSGEKSAPSFGTLRERALKQRAALSRRRDSVGH